MATWSATDPDTVPAFEIVTEFDPARLAASPGGMLPPDLLLDPELDVVALQQMDDLGGSMENTCSALGDLTAAMALSPVVSDEETDVPAVYIPGTGTLLMQSMPGNKRRADRALMAPILVDAEWATYFFNRVTEVLRSVETQVRANADGKRAD